MSPGTFSINPNGVGLGQGKTFFRGFRGRQYTMTFDGIPFEDTNDADAPFLGEFSPAQWLGGTDFDRSPGQASTFGPDNFGGSINLLSRRLGKLSGHPGERLLRLLQYPPAALDYDSGQFGPGGARNPACLWTFTSCCRMAIRLITTRRAWLAL